MIKDTGDRTPMGDTGFVRDAHAGKGRMDLLPWHAVLELSQLCEEGALKYGERNIDKGAPLHSLLDSGARHLAKYIAGEQDEDHLRAAAWNIMWALEQRTTHPECNDMPRKNVTEATETTQKNVAEDVEAKRKKVWDYCKASNCAVCVLEGKGIDKMGRGGGCLDITAATEAELDLALDYIANE